MPSRSKILSLLAVNIILLSIVNYLARPFYWYYLIWWFDIPMHFWGGVVVLFLVLYIFYSRISRFSKVPFLYLILSVFIVGVGWEVFEYIVNNVIAGQAFSLFDTISDICFDVAGGCVAFLSITFKKQVSNMNTTAV